MVTIGLWRARYFFEGCVRRSPLKKRKTASAEALKKARIVLISTPIQKASAGEGGEGGIRTLGTVAHTTVFETVPFDRSGTSPSILILQFLFIGFYILLAEIIFQT